MKSRYMKNKAKETGEALGTLIRKLCNGTTVLFVALRACEITEWGLLAVLSPFFFSLGLELFALMILGVIHCMEERNKGENNENAK